jgi:hypothetical protein
VEGEVLEVVEAEQPGDAVVVADLAVGVERDVAGVEADLVPQEVLDAAAVGADDRQVWPQNRPWWVISRSAPMSAACSSVARVASTATATLVTSSRPSTCRPLSDLSS